MITVIIPVGPNADDGQLARAMDSAARNDCRLVVQPDPAGQGTGWARNRALERVETEYMLALDADDWLLDGAVEALERHAQEMRVVYGDLMVGSVRRRQNGVTLEKLLSGVDVPAVTALYPAALLRQVGGWREDMAGLEDVELWARLLKAGVQPYHVEAVVLGYEHNRNGRHTANTGEAWARLRALYKTEWEIAQMTCCGKRIPRPAAETALRIDAPAYVLYTGRRSTAFGYPGPKTGMGYHVHPGVVLKVEEADVWGLLNSGLFRMVTEEEMTATPGDPAARAEAWQGVEEGYGDGA